MSVQLTVAVNRVHHEHLSLSIQVPEGAGPEVEIPLTLREARSLAVDLLALSYRIDRRPFDLKLTVARTPTGYEAQACGGLAPPLKLYEPAFERPGIWARLVRWWKGWAA